MPAARATQKIIIDGDLADEAWKAAPVADSFVQRQPSFGKPESYKNRTEVKILYDDNAIYIGGYCHEGSKDSVSSELVGRDVIGVNDFVGVLFDTYNDKINGFGYYVTPLGEQYDAKYSSTGEDGSWNSVYKSAAKLVGDGWTFEMRIPYSAIRFGKANIQNWGMNIFRRRRKAGENLTWNPIDQKEYSFFAQFGLWANITNIKPPVRLSFSPYLSTDIENYPYNNPNLKNTTARVNGGMDVKYGINQSFTLDMTLVPDFGQVQSDNHVLNLTPFEVKYNEYRSFFTEGTELFSKGSILYSRRIGGTPIHFYDVQNNLNAGDSILKNPTESKLINATKVSGRTASGLGIGFLNAVTAAQYATIQDANKHEYQVQTNPLTNYNIFVLDQSLKHNSSISLINTNVSRNSKDYNANVTAGLWDLYDKKVKWNFFGKMALSQLYGYPVSNNQTQTQLGYNHNLNFAKVSGNFNFTVSQYYTDDKYTHQDLGYYTNNNFLDHELYLGYKWLKPRSFYNNMYYNFDLYYSRRYIQPASFQGFYLNTNVNGQFKTLGYYFFKLNITSNENDFYEPRKPIDSGYVFKRPGSWLLGFNLQSNDAKKLSGSIGEYHRFYHTYQSTLDEIDLSGQYRFNKKLSANIVSTINIWNNNLGYATTVNDSVIIGLRRVRSVENIYTAKYNFTNKMGISFRLRHYWSKLTNGQLKYLSKDGSMANIDGISQNADYNINFFNIDMVYTWQFALGSFLTVTWKNAIGTSDQSVYNNYVKNLGTTLHSNELNTVSIKMIYFLDYLDIKKHKG
ncbi:DUF5916 domain-containing protein [Parasediminibacterium sp. JCM 36343]|uniref:DUF5916 domain-containing protein n=1 Tax=Parasediminibacterium sp. JCM 36343 TaxID=3374279 RepID=UPI00397AF993